MQYRILTSGDSSVTIELGKAIDEKVNAMVRSVKRTIEKANIEGITEFVQTYCSVAVHYNPIVLDFDTLCAKINSLLEHVSSDNVKHKKRIMNIPVLYGGKYGPDLDFVCQHTRLSAEEVIKLHSEPDYRIFMMGFLPGFVYLGGMNEKLITPRLESPRERIVAGSVGIAANQTGMYPLDSPGGWQIIGRTPIKPYDHDREKPILYEAGDYIHFYPIDKAEYKRIRELVKNNEYEYEWCRED